MSKQITFRRSRGSAALTGNLMLAPMVVAMRVPVMALEAGDFAPWRGETMRAVSEKAAAAVDGLIAAQMSLARSAAAFWPDLFSGKMPAQLGAAAVERSVHAALRPAGRRVKSNFRRLTRKA